MQNSDKDNIKLICDISELSNLFTDSNSLENFLSKTVEMVASHMKADVCSIYLYSDGTQELILKATMGLNQGLIGNVKMNVDEGLTGLALKELRPICERNASRNPNFKYFPDLGEEIYESFLAVPILRGTNKVGVMVIQNSEKNYFKEGDVTVLQAITSQLANTIEMARFLLSLDEDRQQKKVIKEEGDLKFVKGRVGSPGFVFAEAVVLLESNSLWLNQAVVQEHTVDDFYKALKDSEHQLEDMQTQIEETLADIASFIFNAQILMLKDSIFVNAMVDKIKKGIKPHAAIIEVAGNYLKKFDNIADEYLKDRSQDVKDICRRILSNLIGFDVNATNCEGRILIAKELSAGDVLKYSSEKVKGIILLSGGVTSHVCILASSLQLPVIIADEPRLMSIRNNTRVLMDAEIGNLYINPTDDIIESFREKQKLLKTSAEISSELKEKTFTADGSQVHLLANINLLGDLKIAKHYKAEGVGLYRTEFPFIVRKDFPSEEEQLVVYKKLFEGMPGKEMTIRTLDIGGDKVLSYFQEHSREKNPFMGMRSVRFSLRHKDIFAQQIRAILRASVGADVKIMFPMISSVDEFVEAKQLVLNCVSELRSSGAEFQVNPTIGMMIEMPSVMEILEELANYSDFFSIGTNDFVQYMLAVDRTNERVADMYLSHHPSILRAIKKVVDVSAKYGKEVSVCGEMAHEEKYIRYLLGIGVRRFSLSPSYIPKIQRAIMNVQIKDAEAFAKEILSMDKLTDISKKIGIS
ncbi:MAG: phosphoenolpyruvate--protein phosphotransferase [Omnitrophica WOR_2 bacterium GWF2_38_59]|nr:MAG: phosphoenolpyruvate--protein phosphotransferase [Omnitrophica WOR_2 bacterium GWA2_37_7]OGX21978.1 MAG: phosphoenolpyruvate--protein phosphotransferase [Omnitrophica WOR_2 bacterium GWF2_38_59]OGX50256.1 MAG: phosphoenolpyruvate--protein phosphotransferase [Omnitrophica WOR_2 bacterium RIFOXYA2_FULL_38_17]OGX54054.1 MAG: phosphoenolpyruvate--protein phosphotransferase [Omnitrophica WOR_2 bacterium RIFOXYA12_FULL_38_10]OGX56735.1 MAG: phosphoenolpyruvate--protein phosphotransferase [Omni